MTPAEQAERERVAYVLDALLAITAVALNAEQIAQAETEQQRVAVQPGINSDWLRRAA